MTYAQTSRIISPIKQASVIAVIFKKFFISIII